MLNTGDIFGDYRVVKPLGKGGMGEVWLLESAKTGQQFAAKILAASLAGDHSARRRFVQEAELAMGARHESIVATYDVGEDPDTGLAYIIMEYMPGGTLAERIARHGALSVWEAVAVVGKIAGALTAARQKGIVHRDIKPSNIMFTFDGTPKLADLGIARSSGGMDITITQTGMMLGTPAYMAPEQMLNSHDVDTRADIYSLGIVLFEMLTGERPYKGDTAVELVAKAVAGEAIPDVRTVKPDIPAPLAQLLGAMCALKLEARIDDPAKIVEWCEKFLASGIFAPSRKRRRLQTSRIWAFAAGSVLLCAVAVVAAFLSLRSRQSSSVATNLPRPIDVPDDRVTATPRIPVFTPPAPRVYSPPSLSSPKPAVRPDPTPAARGKGESVQKMAEAFRMADGVLGGMVSEAMESGLLDAEAKESPQDGGALYSLVRRVVVKVAKIDEYKCMRASGTFRESAVVDIACKEILSGVDSAIGAQAHSIASDKCKGVKFGRRDMTWVVGMLERNERNLLARYFKARKDELKAGRLKEPVSADNAVALMSIAAGDLLFDWFSSRCTSVSEKRATVRIPDRIRPRKSLEVVAP